MSQVDRSKVITDTETVDQGDADTDRESPAGPEESPSLRVCDLHEVDLSDGGHHSQPLQDPAQVEQPDVALREGEDSPASQEGSTEDHQSQSPTSNIFYKSRPLPPFSHCRISTEFPGQNASGHGSKELANVTERSDPALLVWADRHLGLQLGKEDGREPQHCSWKRSVKID